MRQGTPTSTGPVPEQRGYVTGGRTVRRSGETGGRATVPDIHVVFQARSGGDRGHDDGTRRETTVRPAPNLRCHGRLRLVAGRVARMLAHVRQEGPTDETGVLSSQGDWQKGET